MGKILFANQEYPLDLLNKKIKSRRDNEELYRLIKVVISHYPDYNLNDIKNIFTDLKTRGCTYTAITNAIINQLNALGMTDEQFSNIFGFSLSKDDIKNYNMLLVDIFATLHNLVKIKINEYDSYSYETIKEAALGLLNVECSTDSEASLLLFDNNIVSDGYDTNGNLKFKRTIPRISQAIGTYQEIAARFFNIHDKNITKDDLIKLFQEKNAEIIIEDFLPEQKLSGLTNNNMIFWINYYFKKRNLDFNININSIPHSNNGYEEFSKIIQSLKSNNHDILVSVGPSSNVFIHNSSPFSWTKIANEKAGHAMTFMNFNSNGDIVVSTWGKNYIIPKEYYLDLEFKAVKINSNEINQTQKSR